MTVRQPLSCTSVITAVSMSSTVAIAGSTRTAPRAKTSTTSLPVTKRAMSKSWIVMSRKIPPEPRRYSSGGGAGSRLEMRTSCGSPTVPSATAAATAACAGSKRRLKPIWNGTPVSSTTASARSTCARSSDTGFSQKIALPARAASTIRSACVPVGEQIATASTSSAASSSSTLRRRRRADGLAISRAVSSCASWTAVTDAPGTWRASRSACMRPMRPTPITPMRTVWVDRGHQSSRSETTRLPAARSRPTSAAPPAR